MFRTREDQEAAIRAAHYEIEKRKAIEAVYAKFPLLVRCMANDQEILDIVRLFAGPSVIPSAELFFSALDENPDAMNTLAQQSEAITRRQLTQQIIDLLAAKGKGHDTFTLRQEEKRLALLSIPALRSRLADLQMKAKMASTDVATLKQFVSHAHRDHRPFPGWPTLPTRMVPPGEIFAVAVDAEYLNGLLKNDIWQFKRLVKLYGSEQIDSRRGIK
jgi:hypothetical protein